MTDTKIKIQTSVSVKFSYDANSLPTPVVSIIYDTPAQGIRAQDSRK